VPDITVSHLTAGFGRNIVLDDVEFDVTDGEFFTLLGPSGCGKTTTLLALAGFLKPTRGVIRCGETTFVDRERKINLPAERRNLGMVFQSYAVWPHMTVAQNVAFPLKVRRTARRAIRGRVAETLELLELGGLEQRYPHELSGGQRQRVALARALVYEPSVLLLDEPFSNLDAKLRERARSWLKELQQRLGLTTVFVTHDQDEALSMSDRIVVMDQGQIQQVGTPEEVYREPANHFVATFLGRCNVMDGVVRATTAESAVEVEIGSGGLRLLVAAADAAPTGSVSVVIRPEAIRLVNPRAPDVGNGAGSERNVFDVSITDVSFLGDHYEYRLSASGLTFLAQSPYEVSGPGLKAAIDPTAVRLVGSRPDQSVVSSRGDASSS
jgi:iron(III) transport system ATP-binding protein